MTNSIYVCGKHPGLDVIHAGVGTAEQIEDKGCVLCVLMGVSVEYEFLVAGLKETSAFTRALAQVMRRALGVQPT